MRRRSSGWGCISRARRSRCCWAWWRLAEWRSDDRHLLALRGGPAVGRDAVRLVRSARAAARAGLGRHEETAAAVVDSCGPLPPGNNGGGRRCRHPRALAGDRGGGRGGDPGAVAGRASVVVAVVVGPGAG